MEVKWKLLPRSCGGLKDIAPNRLTYLNSWFSVSGTLWEGLGDVVLLEEVSWGGGRSLQFQRLTPLPLSSLNLLLVNKGVNS